MNNKQTAERIKKMCKKQKTPIKTILEKCEINRNLIYDLEKKNKKPSCEVLEKIADELNCSVDYLLGRTDIPEINRGDKATEQK